MNTLWIVVIAAVVIYVAYNFYAKQIDRNIIKSDAKKATPAKMYMDGVDFMPTSRNVLYGYHFKSIAAAGPIVGPTFRSGASGSIRTPPARRSPSASIAKFAIARLAFPAAINHTRPVAGSTSVRHARAMSRAGSIDRTAANRMASRSVLNLSKNGVSGSAWGRSRRRGR